jgi:hypothetical protein
MESMALNELAELLGELEQTLLTLKVTKDPGRRRLLVRKMSRLFAEIERNPCHAQMSHSHPARFL